MPRAGVLFLAIFVDAALLIISVLYFLLGTKAPTVTYISDLDFTRTDYRVIVTTFVLLQVGTTCAYVFARRARHPVELGLVILAMALAVAGWFIVSFVHTSPVRSTRNKAFIHIVGARMYAFGSLGGFVFLLWDTWQRYRLERTRWHRAFFVGMAGVAVVVCVFGLLFDRGESFNWIYEHIIFIAYITGHLLFFINILQDDGDRDGGAFFELNSS